MKSVIACFLVLFILAMVTTPSAAAAGQGEVKIRFTDKSRLNYEGDWAIISYQAYTSKTVGSGKRMGTMTCRPGLSGTYRITAEYKATENRGRKARYLVDGQLVKTVNQHTASGSSFPKVTLGVFALTAGSTVSLEAKDGHSYSFVSFRFRPTDGPATGPDGDTPPVDHDGGNNPGKVPGSEWTAARDGELTIRPCLSTYAGAGMTVTVDGKVVFRWKRANDRDGSRAVFQGKEDPDSIVENSPGDFSPSRTLQYRFPVKKGQTVKAIQSGQPGPAAFLKVEGPWEKSGSGSAMDRVLELR